MIPTTPEDCDDFIADVSAAIMAALAAPALSEVLEIADSSDENMALATEAVAMRSLTRAEFAVQEAETLLVVLQRHARVKREADGTPIDADAADPTKRRCAHGATLAEPCAACAADDPFAGASGDGNGDALAAFTAGLQGGPVS